MLTMTRVEAIPYASMKAGLPWDWVTFPEFLDSVDRRPKGINILPYVPLAPLLTWVMGMEQAKIAQADRRRDPRDVPAAQRGDGRGRMRLFGAAAASRQRRRGAARLRRHPDGDRRDAQRHRDRAGAGAGRAQRGLHPDGLLDRPSQDRLPPFRTVGRSLRAADPVERGLARRHQPAAPSRPHEVAPAVTGKRSAHLRPGHHH